MVHQSALHRDPTIFVLQSGHIAKEMKAALSLNVPITIMLDESTVHGRAYIVYLRCSQQPWKHSVFFNISSWARDQILSPYVIL